MARRGPRRDERYRAELLTVLTLLRKAVQALYLALYPPAIERREALKRRQGAQARRKRKRQAEAWLRRQLDGLGKGRA